MSQPRRVVASRPGGVGRRFGPWLAAVLFAALVATLLAYHVSLTPPALHPREVQFSVAKAEVFVDSTTSELTYNGQIPYRTAEYQVQNGPEAQTLAQWLQTIGPLRRIASAAGAPGKLALAAGPYSETLTGPTPSLPDVARNIRLLVDVNGTQPMITLYGQAPTTAQAVAIVASARAQLIERVAAQRAAARLPTGTEPFVIRSLGATTSGIVDHHGQRNLLLVSFLLVFLAGAGLIVWKRGAPLRAARAARESGSSLEPPDPGTDLWPHTRRFLPWSVAVFLVMIFLVPIDAIFGNNTGSGAATPTPDRVLLVIMGVAWVVALIGNRGLARPRVRFTRIHVMLLVFVAIAFLSVGLSGFDLAFYQQVMPSVKKLLVLVTWLVFFLITASVVRPGEVRPFLKLVVGLGVLCALGTVLERATHFNIFYFVWTSLHVPVNKPPEMDVIDDIGRLGVVGPTNQPLELATLLSVVLGPAIVFTLRAENRRDRLIWGLATMTVMAGALATSRKTSVVAPVIGLLVLIAYRPRPMLRGLAAAIIPAILVIHVLAPGQLGSVISELEPSHATSVNTDQVRVKRYDTIRPDVLSHLVVGDGYQSYDPQQFQYLDNEYLMMLITAGVLGLFGLLGIFFTMFTVSHPMIRGPDADRSDAALALQTMLVMILVCCALFDTLSFSHVTYMVFFCGAMLVALGRRGVTRAPAARAAGERTIVQRPARRRPEPRRQPAAV